jgi:hypothetical protein
MVDNGHLTITRYDGEWFQLKTPDGQIIRISLHYRGSKTKERINAPKDHKILRGEHLVG